MDVAAVAELATTGYGQLGEQGRVVDENVHAPDSGA